MYVPEMFSLSIIINTKLFLVDYEILVFYTFFRYNRFCIIADNQGKKCSQYNFKFKNV